MNILSFDIEEWYIEKFYKSGEAWKYKAYDEMLDKILNLLEEHNIKATFFCLGALVEHFPYVIKKIAEHGHEIGCHSLNHRWVNKQTYDEFFDDTYKAVQELQNCAGSKVESFRAPAFSIGESNKWAFEALVKCGIKNDASIFPGMRDFGGFPSFSGGSVPSRVIYKDSIVNEFPITMGSLPIIGKQIAYSGGGYFRLLPLSFVKSQMNMADYVMCYFHIADLLDFKSKLMTRQEYERYFKEEGSLKNRIIRYAKSNLRRKRAFAGLSSLVSEYKFLTVRQAAGCSASFPEVIL